MFEEIQMSTVSLDGAESDIKKLFQCDRESIKILTTAPNSLLAKKGRLFSKAAEEYLSHMLGRLSPLAQMKLLTNPSGVDASLFLSAFDTLDEEDFNNYVNRLLPQLRWYKSKYQEETLGVWMTSLARRSCEPLQICNERTSTK